MADKQLYTRGDAVDSPSRDQVAVTPSDSTDLAAPTKALMVTVAGNVTAIGVDSSASVLYPSVPAYTVLPIRVKRVYATGTAATVVALY